jgi:predicted hydrocarbon binding protein
VGNCQEEGKFGSARPWKVDILLNLAADIARDFECKPLPQATRSIHKVRQGILEATGELMIREYQDGFDPEPRDAE